ncbi:thioredoxin family protein [Maribacter sp. SA7]|uniref:thioredoxin family protein n=1 Tax=Maribacter zhoushanensis TaxID=3030012 RepID=UPI0023EC688D|nr:thioredoxin family protein [Maribacter zhoushanensis]MDF4204335.1 thioredoxin family protein [Maribacter zhoushanensis]
MKKKFRKSIGSETPTLVYFFASWCVPCKLMRPVLKEVVEEFHTGLNYLEIDVELKKRIVKRYK